MSEIKNIEGLTASDINREMERGGKFITFANPNYKKIYNDRLGWNILGQIRVNI